MEINDFRYHQLRGVISVVILLGFLVYSHYFKSGIDLDNELDRQLTPTANISLVINTETPTSEIQGGGSIESERTTAEIGTVDNLSLALEQIKQQEETDQYLLEELQCGDYSFTDPLVVINPYNISPLTGLILFTSEKPLKISIHIMGKDDLTDVDFTFDGYNFEHIIPIYGLYPGSNNMVLITSEDENGETNQNRLQITTEPLPKVLEDIIILTDLPIKDRYHKGFNFTYENGGEISKTAFDVDGVFRWFLTNKYLGPSVYVNGRYYFALPYSSKGEVLLFEMNPLGRIYKMFYVPYRAHHDIIRYQGNLLITGSMGETMEDVIYELDTQSGRIIHILDLKTVFQRTRQGGIVFVEHPDWLHNNAIAWVEDEKIIISGRNQSIIAKISWPYGDIDWILSSPNGWLPMFEKYLLHPIGENFEWQYAQHSPEVLPDQDNNPDTMDILLFDNGVSRFDYDFELQKQIRANEIIAPELYSRIVQFRVNEKEKTVQQIWQFGKEYGSILYAPAHGDADLLPNGNRLALFDIESEPITNIKNNATYFEVTDKSEIVWSAQAVSKKKNGEQIEYRTARMNIYNQSANDLQIGTPVINLIPAEILEQYEIQ